VLTGTIFHSAVMTMSVLSPEFRDRYLSNPDHPNRFEGRAVVFDGPEDYHHRIDDPALAIDENTMLFMRGAGADGSAESKLVIAEPDWSQGVIRDCATMSVSINDPYCVGWYLTASWRFLVVVAGLSITLLDFARAST